MGRECSGQQLPWGKYSRDNTFILGRSHHTFILGRRPPKWAQHGTDEEARGQSVAMLGPRESWHEVEAASRGWGGETLAASQGGTCSPKRRSQHLGLLLDQMFKVNTPKMNFPTLQPGLFKIVKTK